MTVSCWYVLGTAVEVDADRAVLVALADLLGPPVHERPAHRVVVPDHGPLLVDGVPDPAAGPAGLLAVAAALNRLALAASGDLCVHAGVVALDGRALALPAVSGAGKSTLVAACVLAGAAYVSDEALVLSREDGRLRPYPRPLGLSSWSLAALGLAPAAGEDGERLVPGRELGAVWDGSGVLELRWVLTPRRAAAARARLTPWHRAEAARELLDRSFNAHRGPDRALTRVTALVRGAECAVLHHDGPHEAAALLVDLLRG